MSAPTFPLEGRRLPDTKFGKLPRRKLRNGDYWRCTGVDPRYPSNLTGIVMQFYFEGYGVGTLMRHTVREEDDGTFSVRQNDGSSNSIPLVSERHGGEFFHGWIEHGVWS